MLPLPVVEVARTSSDQLATLSLLSQPFHTCLELFIGQLRPGVLVTTRFFILASCRTGGGVVCGRRKSGVGVREGGALYADLVKNDLRTLHKAG